MSDRKIGNGLDAFNYFGRHKKHQNYFLRFRYAFPDIDSFVSAFPEEKTKQTAMEWYPIIMASMGNRLVNGLTKDQCGGILATYTRLFQNMFFRLKESNALSLEDIFSNDVIETINNKNIQDSSENGTSKQNSTSNSKSTNYDANNEYEGDKDNFDDSHGKADKYLQDGTNNDSNADSQATDFNKSHSNGTSDTTKEKKDTQYDPNKIMMQIALSKNAGGEYISSVLNGIGAPYQPSFEKREDNRGDF